MICTVLAITMLSAAPLTLGLTYLLRRGLERQAQPAAPRTRFRGAATSLASQPNTRRPEWGVFFIPRQHLQ